MDRLMGKARVSYDVPGERENKRIRTEGRKTSIIHRDVRVVL